MRIPQLSMRRLSITMQTVHRETLPSPLYTRHSTGRFRWHPCGRWWLSCRWTLVLLCIKISTYSHVTLIQSLWFLTINLPFSRPHKSFLRCAYAFRVGCIGCVCMCGQKLPVWDLNYHLKISHWCSLIEFNCQKSCSLRQEIHSGKEILKHSINRTGESQGFWKNCIMVSHALSSPQWIMNAECPMPTSNYSECMTYNITIQVQCKGMCTCRVCVLWKSNIATCKQKTTRGLSWGSVKHTGLGHMRIGYKWTRVIMSCGYYNISHTHNYTTTTENYDTIVQHHVLLVASRYKTNTKQIWNKYETNMDTLTCLPISMLTSLSSSKSLLLPTNSSTTA